MHTISPQPPVLKFLGATAMDNLVIVTSLGSEVARVYNDSTTQLSGNATVLGDTAGSGALYAPGLIACNQTLALIGNATVGGQLISTKANDTANGKGQL